MADYLASILASLGDQRDPGMLSWLLPKVSLGTLICNAWVPRYCAGRQTRDINESGRLQVGLVID